MAKLNFKLSSKGVKVLSAVAGAALTVGMTANSYGALLVDFKPEPSPSGRYEVEYGGSPAQLIAIDGAIGNSDLTTAGGLRIETPFALSLPAEYASSVQQTSAGTTIFQDVTLVFSNLTASGPAQLTSIAPGVNLVTQLLATGQFELQSYDPVGDAGKVTLLKGTIENAVISGLAGARAGGVFSAKVTYEDGLIKDALETAGGTLEGEMSWSLLELDVPMSAGGDPLVLAGFKASLVGQFGTPAIPEPAGLGLLAVAGAGLVARRRAR